MIKLKTDFNEDFNIPKKNIICYLLFFGVIIAFFAVYIWPGIKEIEKMNLQIESLQVSIKKQEKLFPFYEILTEENKRFSNYDILNSSEIEKCDSQGLMFEIKKKCQNNRVDITDFKPAVKMLEDNSEHLSFNIEMQGSFTNLRQILKQIAMLSCVEHIEKIDIKKIDLESGIQTHKISLLLHGSGNGQMQTKGN